MNQQLLNDISKYVEDHIGEFHAARIAKLQNMNLKEILKRKNPYMYRAKDLTSAGQLVESLAAATMSSAEESIFGNWMEGVAMFVAEKVYGGYKSSAEGIDLEFDKDGIHYFVSVKSGPAWSNSNGNDNKGYNDSDHEKYCGEKFWTLISGESTLFVDIIEPLGYKAKEKNEEYYKAYNQMLNKFVREFVNEYCNDNNDIEWDKIVRLNAAVKQTKENNK